MLGVHAGRVRLAAEGGPNAFPCRALEAVEDVSAMLVPLLPEEGCPPPLWMETPKDVWRDLPEKRRLWVSIRPEDLLLLS